MRLSVIRALSDVPESDWQALAGTAEPFQHHALLNALEVHDCLEPQGWLPHHMLAWDGERLVGAMPLYLRDNSQGEFVFDWNWAEAYARAGGDYYQKLVTAVPFTPVTGARLLLAPEAPPETAEALVEAAIGLAEDNSLSSWHCLFPHESQLPLLSGADLIRREGCQYHWFNHGYTDFEQFLETLTSKRRKEIRRERRDIPGAGVEIEIHEGSAIPDEIWQTFHRFYCDTFDRKWGSPRLTLNFFRTLSQSPGLHPVLFLARLEGEYVAGAFALRGPDTLYGRHWGCTRFVRNLHFELCYYQTIEYAIRHGLSRVDAGAQGEHKIARGFNPVRTWSVHWIRDPSFRRAVADFCRREERHIEAYVSQVNSATAYREVDQ